MSALTWLKLLETTFERNWKYMSLLFEIWAGIRCTTHDGKVELNTFEYTTAFLNSDWPYFLWHGIKLKLSRQDQVCLNLFREPLDWKVLE